jgi:pilus assembly protein Flp/PilA
MGKRIRLFARDETASVTVQYGLIAFGLSVAIVTVLQGIGMRLTASFDDTSASPR